MVTRANIFYLLTSFVTMNFQVCNCKLKKKKGIITHTLISCLKCHYIVNVIHANVIFYVIYSTAVLSMIRVPLYEGTMTYMTIFLFLDIYVVSNIFHQ